MKQFEQGTAFLPAIVSRETSDRLEAYVSLLLKWNRVINLISRKDEESVHKRHIADGLQLLRHLPPAVANAIDLGSGGGIPGLVLAIASGCHFHLVESDHRKASFLREAARITEAPVTVHAIRIDQAILPKVQLVTARALAPLTVLIGLAEPFLLPGGMLLAPKGANAEAELTEASQQWHMRVVRSTSATSATATILQITEVQRVGHTA